MKPSNGVTKVTDKVNSATVIMLVMRGHHYKTINQISSNGNIRVENSLSWA